MQKITYKIRPSWALDPRFYQTKKELRQKYPNAVLIEVVPDQVTIIQPQNV